jgi:transglutaminase-like putative cysteine protease
VHGYLSYQEQAPLRSVVEAVQDRRGDCTEYADLFTTLSRSLGIPSRSVVGLAYSDTAGPGFALHAWNEVIIDGRWVAVDPTWNQPRVDATHLPLPTSTSASMSLLAAIPHMRFRVRDVEYFDGVGSQ